MSLRNCAVINYIHLYQQNWCHHVYHTSRFSIPKNEEFQICLHVPDYPLLSRLSLQCSWELSVILQGHEQDLLEWTRSCSTLVAYLECLQNLIMKCLESATAKSLLHSGERLTVESYKHIISELETLSQENIVYVSNVMNEVKLQAIDSAARCHYLTLLLGMSYPSTPPVIQVDLPEQVAIGLKKSSSIAGIYKSFVQHVTALQKFWKSMDEIDSKCWILDPDNPTRKDSHRRIMIGNNVSVQITVDPLNASERPDIKFLGSERAIMPFQESLAENFEKWNGEKDFVQNLKFVLGLSEFPAAPMESGNSQDLVQKGDCCICFAARLNGELPSRACNNEKCGMMYHEACLFEWLQTLPSSSKSFNYIHGDCPNCGMVT
ncbi:hypothetical protein L9F63_005529, partial [Diploptera punctata]